MDKVIEIMLVAVVLLITAVVALTLLNSEAEGFSTFISGETDSAKCDLWESQDPKDRPEKAEDCPTIDDAGDG